MKYLSVCSGIEAATSAWHPLGWEPVAFAEIEPFPSAVLKHHYPNVPNLGDMSKFKEWNLGTIDLLVGGTPCQSFSVAGLRKGLDDPRGNLMLTFGALARHFAPRWLVWENVPGVLSSNGGRDFGTFLGMLGELGYGFAYRVLDAQYFGVAQRRRRVFVVGCLGDWRSAAAVLFERDSLSGHPAPSREARKGTTTSSQPSPSYGGSNAECADTVTSKWAKGSGGPSGNEGGLFVAQPAVLMDQGGSVMEVKTDGIVGTLRRETHGHEPVIMQPLAVPEVMSTLLSSTAGISRPGNAVTEHETYIPMAFAQNTRDEVRWVNGDGQIAGALAAESGMKQTTYVAQPIPIDLRNANRDPEKHDEMNRQGVGIGEEGDPSHTLTSACVHGVAQPKSFAASSIGTYKEGVGTLRANGGDIGGGSENLIAQPINIYGGNKRKDRPDGGFYVRMDEQTSKTLDAASGLNPTAAQGGTAIIQPIAWDEDLNARENVMGTLIRGPQGGRRSGVAQSIVGALSCNTGPNGHDAGNFACNQAVDAGHVIPQPINVQDVADPLTACFAKHHGASGGKDSIPRNHITQSMAVRRLTPVECERLQGFPDNHTAIPWRGKDASQCPDGPRYKALGNSMAVPVMAWIGQRIEMVNELQK